MFSHVFACILDGVFLNVFWNVCFFGSYVFVCFEMYALCFICFWGKYAFYFDSYEVCFSNYQNRWGPCIIQDIRMQTFVLSVSFVYLRICRSFCVVKAVSKADQLDAEIS